MSLMISLDSARSGRKRIQVGTTNRSGLSALRTDQDGDVHGRCRGSPAARITTAVPRSTYSTDGPSRSTSTLGSPCRMRDLAQEKPRETLRTSRSMPSLGTSRQSQRLQSGLEQEKRGESREVIASSTTVLAEGVNGTPTVRSVGGDSYMTSTQMAYMTGLHPPPSNVPVMDPYRHRQLLHDRWINRASQRLGDIATLKYGSIREFFRMYDSKCDGVLDFDEFSEGITMCQLDHLFPRSLQRTVFDKIDTDKSGSIELNEFAAFLGQSEDKGAAAGELSVWQKQEAQRKAGDAEARSVALQPIKNHKAQRIKNKLSNCLSKVELNFLLDDGVDGVNMDLCQEVPNASAGLADNRTMFLRKQFALLSEQAVSKGINLEDLVQALGPRGMNLGVSDEDLRLLVKEMDANSDGNVTLNEFSAFINLDDHEPLYQPLFDGRRRNVNILQSMVEEAPPAESAEEAFFRVRADQLHSEAVPSKVLDREVRVERDRIAEEVKAKHSRGRFARPDSPAWTVGGDTVTVSTPSGRTVVDVWDLPPATRHLSSVKRSLTSSMRHLPRTAAAVKDGASVSFASEGGPFVTVSRQESLSPKKNSLASLSSGHELFSSLEQGRLEDATAGALARARKVAKQTWADIGHGGIGIDAGTDESSSYYTSPNERFTTTNSERYAPLIKMKKIEKGQRSAGFCRHRSGDSAAEAFLRQQKSEERSKRVRAHMERIALSVKTEEVAARLKEERRIRGKARTRLRYNQWVNSMDNWLSDEVPKLADYNKRQFPTQNIRLRSGQQVHEALGGPLAMAV